MSTCCSEGGDQGVSDVNMLLWGWWLEGCIDALHSVVASEGERADRQERGERGGKETGHSESVCLWRADRTSTEGDRDVGCAVHVPWRCHRSHLWSIACFGDVPCSAALTGLSSSMYAGREVEIAQPNPSMPATPQPLQSAAA